MMKRTDSKAPRTELAAELDSAKQVLSFSNAYKDAIDSIETRIVCSVGLANGALHDDVTRLAVTPKKESICYRNPDGTYSYRDTAFVLSAKGAEYRLACAGSGKVHLYKMEGDEGVPYGKFSYDRISDPLFAFAYKGSVYIVFNLPTLRLISLGPKARIPSISSGGVVAEALGTVSSLRFSGNDVRELEPPITALGGYYAALVGDSHGLPILLCANLDGASNDEDEEEKKHSFKKLISGLLDDDDEAPLKPKRLPVGVSVKRFSDDADWVQVPMSGDAVYGIKSVELSEAEDGADKLKIIAPAFTVEQRE